uniref:Uncharacterized protein n=1 Tax=Tetranychus urticae TaxID=32264 RepID=T1KIK9_TETUR
MEIRFSSFDFIIFFINLLIILTSRRSWKRNLLMDHVDEH